jgi:hypothetical protein
LHEQGREPAGRGIDVRGPAAGAHLRCQCIQVRNRVARLAEVGLAGFYRDEWAPRFGLVEAAVLLEVDRERRGGGADAPACRSAHACLLGRD